MTQNQIAALKYLIIVSKAAPDIAKRVMFYLIDQSAGLTESVCLSLVDGRKGFDEPTIRQVARMDAMQSSNCQTHLSEVMVAMGSPLLFSHHYGDFNPKRKGDPFNNDGQFAGYPIEVIGGRNPAGAVKEGMPLRYTFWLANEFYSCKAKYVSISREEVERIKLKEPELKYWT